MSGQVVPLPDLVVGVGQTSSNILYAEQDFRDADSLTFFGPSTLPETATVQVGHDVNGVDWYPLFRGGADVTIPANKAVTVELPSFKRLRILLSVGAAAERRFKLDKGFWA